MSRRTPEFPTPDNTRAPLLVTPREAGTMLSLGVTRIYELLRGGELSSFHVGRARRISTQSIVKYVERQLAAQDDNQRSISRAPHAQSGISP
jgi:excisionase family DNA binding protein